MPRVNPFDALRPRLEVAEQVASVPYDVVNTEEARELARGNELSFLRVVRPEIDLTEGTDLHADEVYEKAASNFQKLQDDGALIRDGKPCIYLYHLQTVLLGRKVSQTGVVCSSHIDDYNQGIIKKHEITRKEKEDDRTRHVLTLNANAGPVFLLYKAHAPLTTLIREGQKGDPLYNFTAPDGVEHTIWRIEDFQPYVDAFAAIEASYVADGHHRSASAARAGAELREKNPNHTGDEEYNWFLTVLFSSDELSILPYNRVVRGLDDQTPEQVLARLRDVGKVEETRAPEPENTWSFGMYLDQKWYRITLPEDSIEKDDPIKSLDYVLLYDRILSPILGIGDIRTDPRIDFVGGIRGSKELEKRVNSGECSIAFAMHAATIDQLIGVADAGEIMPPKSTWFEPKLRSGLLVHTLD